MGMVWYLVNMASSSLILHFCIALHAHTMFISSYFNGRAWVNGDDVKTWWKKCAGGCLLPILFNLPDR